MPGHRQTWTNVATPSSSVTSPAPTPTPTHGVLVSFPLIESVVCVCAYSKPDASQLRIFQLLLSPMLSQQTKLFSSDPTHRFDGGAADAPAAPAKRSRGRTPKPAAAPPPYTDDDMGSWGPPGFDDEQDPMADFEERSLQLADQYFGGQKQAEASGDAPSSKAVMRGAKGRGSARDAPLYPEQDGFRSLLDDMVSARLFLGQSRGQLMLV